MCINARATKTKTNQSITGIKVSPDLRQSPDRHQSDTMSSSRIRQNFHSETETAMNRQVNMELFASYTYQCMSFHFARDDVALPGISDHFADESGEERQHAEKLMKLINQRGGAIVLDNVSKPKKQQWSSMLEAMEDALQLERDVNQSLLELHKVVTKHEDAQLTDFLEGEFLKEQVKAIARISHHITQLKRAGTGLGEFIFDREAFSCSEARTKGDCRNEC